MKRSLLFAVLFLVAVAAFAQNSAPLAQSRPTMPQPPAGIGLPPGLNLPGGLAEGFMDTWWRDPATASRLHLNEDQKRQLETATLNQRLALIDAGADAMKSITRLGVTLDAEHLDEAAYNQQIGALSTAAAHIVQTLGEMAVTPRKVLTYDQWTQLVAIRRARRASTVPRVPGGSNQPPPALRSPMPR